MPTNKDASARYRIIHEILRDGNNHKTKRIAHLCTERMGIPVSLRTIQKDLKDMREDTSLGFNLPIEYDKNAKAYYYEEVPDELFPALSLEESEVSALLFYAKTVAQYRDYPIFSDISQAIEKVLDKAHIPQETKEVFTSEVLVETEKHPKLNGIELIPKILKGIERRRVLEIHYQKFTGPAKLHRIRPLLLKEHGRMWYVIGKTLKYNNLITLALDRIRALQVTQEKFDPVPFDSEKYFRHSFGITVEEMEEVVVTIGFVPFQGNYLKALPIHPTQQIVVDNKDEFIIKVTVKPSFEFYSKILSYGERAWVISPEVVVSEFKRRILDSAKSYK